MSKRKKLWEVDHPYYCNEGNYYKADHHHKYDSWESFVNEAGDSDEELNFVFRWDWRRQWDDKAMEYGKKPGNELLVFMIRQRKGYNVSYSVTVTPKDEPKVYKWLKNRYKHLKAVWEPLV